VLKKTKMVSFLSKKYVYNLIRNVCVKESSFKLYVQIKAPTVNIFYIPYTNVLVENNDFDFHVELSMKFRVETERFPNYSDVVNDFILQILFKNALRFN
jgi:hypothetical protein